MIDNTVNIEVRNFNLTVDDDNLGKTYCTMTGGSLTITTLQFTMGSGLGSECYFDMSGGTINTGTLPFWVGNNGNAYFTNV